MNEDDLVREVWICFEFFACSKYVQNYTSFKFKKDFLKVYHLHCNRAVDFNVLRVFFIMMPIFLFDQNMLVFFFIKDAGSRKKIMW